MRSHWGWGWAERFPEREARLKLGKRVGMLLDATEAMLNQVAFGHHVLLLGFESADHSQRANLERAIDIARSHGGVVEAADIRVTEGEVSAADSTQASWRASFIDAPYLLNTLVSLGIVADTFETACPWSRFDALHATLKERLTAVMQEVCGGGVLSCRFTHVYPDGPAPYYTFIAPGRRGAEAEQWMTIKTASAEILRDFGATITHHHAVGRVHKPWYHQQIPELHREALRAVKATLDPAGVLNPGVLI